MDKDEVLATPAGFATGLGMPMFYDWQIRTVNPFAKATRKEAKLMQVACASPNEGKGQFGSMCGRASFPMFDRMRMIMYQRMRDIGWDKLVRTTEKAY